MISNVLSTGLQGIKQGVQGAEKAATRIAQAGQPLADDTGVNEAGSDIFDSLIEPIVDLKLYENSVKASAKVVKTADEMIGTLLDIKA